MSSATLRRVIFSADDFGMSEEINEAIERAHRQGVLSTTSLMVAAPAAEDAIRRAKRLPDLHVGLHLVVIEGESILKLPEITDSEGQFGSNQFKSGVNYFFSAQARSALKREIEAQFRTFVRTGLTLDHANAHKHMHLHPTIGRLLLEKGQQYGLKAVRTPVEPSKPLGEKPHLDNIALNQWTRLLRHQIRQAGMKTNDHCFGLRWSGHMTVQKMQYLLPRLPHGISEIYFHPATAQNTHMATLMPGYDQKGELEALISPLTQEAIEQAELQPVGWAEL